MECSTCSNTMNLSDKFCGICGAPSPAGDVAVLDERQPAVADIAQSAVGSWEPAVPAEFAGATATVLDGAGPHLPPQQAIRRLPDSPVRYGIDEILWRRYDVLQRGGLAKSWGRLYVTDSRVVFYAHSTGFLFQRPSTLIRETKLSEISGIIAYVSRRFSLALLWVSIVLGVSGIACVFTLILIPLALLLWFFSLICFVALLAGRGRIGSTIIRIHTKEGISAVDVGGTESVAGSIVAVFGAIFHPWRIILGAVTAADLALYGLPGQDSDEVVADLGALIQDLQTRGDTAAAYWQVPSPEAAAERGVALQ